LHNLHAKNVKTPSTYPSTQDYISRLQEVAMNLTEKNRKLRKKHAQLGEKVAALMGVDLVRQRDKWKEGVKELRAVFDGLEKQGIAVTRDWKVHWDHQVRSAFRSGQLFRKWQVVCSLVSEPIRGDWRLIGLDRTVARMSTKRMGNKRRDENSFEFPICV
jgi:hypothetical protein